MSARDLEHKIDVGPGVLSTGRRGTDERGPRHAWIVARSLDQPLAECSSGLWAEHGHETRARWLPEASGSAVGLMA